MKTKGFVLIFIFSLLLCGQALAFDIHISGIIRLPEKVEAVSINPATGIAAAISRQTKTLFFIDTYKNSIIKKIPLDFIPSSVSIDPARNLAIVSSSDGMLNFIDIETAAFIMKLSVGRSIHATTFNESDKTLLIGNSESLMRMDINTGKIIQETSLKQAVKAMAVDSNKDYLLIAFGGKEGLSLYDLKTLGYIGDIQTGSIPSGVSVNPSTNIAIIVSYADKGIFVISTATKEILKAIAFDGQPESVAIDHTRNIALITHEEGITIIKLQNLLPHIEGLIPEETVAGSSGITLSIKGAGFIRDSQARFNLKDLSTIFVDNYNLKAIVPSDELSTPAEVPVAVYNPPPGGGISNSLIFRIINPVPVVESLNPDTVEVNSVFNLRVAGKNFYNGSVVMLNGKKLKTKFISSILLEAVVNQEHTKNAGLYPVVVKNPSFFTSEPKYLNVVKEGELLKKQDKSNEPEKGEGKLVGRVLNTELQPVEGVTVKIKNYTAVTDRNGYFYFEKAPAGKRLILIDGSTAKDTESRYPTIPLTINIESNKVNEMPFQIYLHKQKNRNFKDINPSEDTILTDPEVPGFEMRIPKGVNIIGWDGKPNVKVSVRTVPADRLPVKPLPQNANVRTVYMFYFDKIGGGIPDHPIPVKARNDLGLLPGEKAVLWYYDESPIEGEAPNDWAIAGTGTVTPDGMYIVSDPGVGIPKFCCGATAWGGQGSNTDSTGPEDPDCKGPSSNAGDPVNLATGYFIHEKTDLYIPGLIPVNIKRYYTSKDKNGNEPVGAFGRNTYFEYDWWLGAYGADGRPNEVNPTMFLLIKPGNYQYRFTDSDMDGIFTNETNPEMRGAQVINNGDGTRTLRMRDGTKYRFDYRSRMSGELIEIEDRSGNKLIFERTPRPDWGDDQGGYVNKIITAEGNIITFTQTYTGNFFRTDSITDHSGRTVTYTYDTYNSYPRLLKVVYPDGSSIQYRYDSAGRMSEIINEKGVREVLNEYYDTPIEKQNKVYKQTHIDGGVYLFDYKIAGGNITETSMTSPNGAMTTWRFDDSGAYRDKYITKKTTPDGTTTYARQAGTNLLLSVTDPLGRKTSYTYYANGLIKTETDNLGNTTSYEYESTYGLPTKITDPLGKSTTITYTFSGGKVTKAVIKDPLLNTTTINYNSFGMPTSIIDPNNNTTTLMYENTGKPAELTKIIDPLGNTFSIAYNNLGIPEKITDAKGNVTLYNYDVMGRVTAVTDPLGGLTRYFYDNRGNLTMLIDAKNNMIRYEYDERDRLKKMIDQLGRVETYTYDTSGNLKTMTDRKGQTTSYTYDLMNRPTKITYHDGSFTEYTYDKVGRIDYINDSISGFIDYLYNDFGCNTCTGRGIDRIAKEVTPHGTIDYTYDKAGRRITMTVAGQNVVNYAYDAAGRLISISQKIGNSTRTYQITYDSASRRTSLKIPTSAKNKYVTTTYGYDTANRLLSMLQQGPSAQIENLIYEYDPNGNRTKSTRNAALPLRTGVEGATYDNANEMLTFIPTNASTRNMTYDANGNLLTVSNSCGTTTYTWNARNQLVGLNGFKADCSPLTASFKYDALGRRIEKTINGVTTRYLYDGFDIIQEKNASNAVTANYIRTLNIDEPLTRIKSDGTIRHYVTDALGSVIALTDDTGVVRTTYSYDPFGNVTISGEASDNPFQYTGRENDGTGLYYYRARYYSPDLQRFISEDPIRLWGGNVNFYAYVGNNPVNKIDPMGLFGVDTIIKFIVKQLAKFGLKDPMDKIVPPMNPSIPEEGDDDNDGIPNFQDPDSPWCTTCKKCH